MVDLIPPTQMLFMLKTKLPPDVLPEEVVTTILSDQQQLFLFFISHFSVVISAHDVFIPPVFGFIWRI